MKRIYAIAVLLCSLFFFTSCPSSVFSPFTSNPGTQNNQNSGNETWNIVPVYYTKESPVYSGPSPIFQEIPRGMKSTVTYSDLTGQNLFLVKVNSGIKELSRDMFGTILGHSAFNTKHSTRSLSLPVTPKGGPMISGIFGPVIRYDFEPARNLDITPTLSKNARSIIFENEAYKKKSEYSEADVGEDTFPFFLTESTLTNGTYLVTQELATLVAVGDSCYVWNIHSPIAESFGQQIKNNPHFPKDPYTALSHKFDIIYPIQTNLLGFEKGGGLSPGNPGYGGIDGDPKIHILVFDIDADATLNQRSGVVGYFYSLDEQKNTPNGYKTSNEAEIFYLDSLFLTKYPEVVYSTLIHEFQHMIHYNKKSGSETWYNEMLSMLAEDVLISHLELTPQDVYDAGPIGSRIPTLNAVYDTEGIGSWGSIKNEALISYANTYSFGAFLLRNYGGAELLHEMMSNKISNKESVTDALKSLNTANISFDSVLANYWKAFFFSGNYKKDGEPSFDKTPDAYTLNGYEYTVLPFDIWNIQNTASGEKGIPSNYLGPLIWQLAPDTVVGRTFQIQSTKSWLSITGDISVDFDTTKMTDAATMYLVVR